MDEHVAGRWVGEVYRTKGKADVYAFLLRAVTASGATVLYASDPTRAPLYLGVQLDAGEHMGILVYPFRITRRATRNRPEDELRGQLRYGSEESWLRDHPVALDVAGVDTTIIIGVDIEGGVIVGLDATLWDPLPMGISFYLRQEERLHAQETGWHVWEKRSRGGRKRADARSNSQLETLVAFTPDRLIDYAHLERRARTLGLDPPLRFAAATAMTRPSAPEREAARHGLEEDFALTSREILDIIAGRNRLAVAVRGGVAEHHLEQYLRNAPEVAEVERLDVDAMHDFNVTLQNGTSLRIECKNASPNTDSSGRHKVEVQKTRASNGDKASRFYGADRFDVVAACLYSSTGNWEFRFGSTEWMTRHKNFPDKLAAIQPITDAWSGEIASLAREMASHPGDGPRS